MLILPAKNNWGQLNSRLNRLRHVRHSAKSCAEGQLDDKEIEIDLAAAPMGVEIMAPPGMEEMTSQLQSMFQNFGRQSRKRVN